MKFYLLTMRNEATGGDGYQREAFTSKAARDKWLMECKRDYQADLAKHLNFKGDHYDTPPAPLYFPDEAYFSEVEFTGTRKEMVLAALKYGLRVGTC